MYQYVTITKPQLLNGVKLFLAEFFGTTVDDDGTYFVGTFAPNPDYQLRFRQISTNSSNFGFTIGKGWDADNNTFAESTGAGYRVPITIDSVVLFKNNTKTLFGLVAWQNGSNYYNIIEVIFKLNNKWYLISSSDCIDRTEVFKEISPGYPDITMASLMNNVNLISPNSKYYMAPIYMVKGGTVIDVMPFLFQTTKTALTTDKPIIKDAEQKILFPFKGKSFGIQNYGLLDIL